MEINRGLGSRAGRVRGFELEFVRNIMLSRSRPVSSTNQGTGLKRNCTRKILIAKTNAALTQEISVLCEPEHPKKLVTLR